MSSTIKKEQAALMKEKGKLLKFFKALKKLLAKEFLWILFILILALPVGLVIHYLVENYAPDQMMSMIHQFLEGKPMFEGAYLIAIIGIYFSRTVIGSIKTLSKPAS